MRTGARSSGVADKVTIGNAYGEQSLNNEPLDIERLYREHHALLMYVICRKFRVPEEEAENIIRDVFLSLIQTQTHVGNPKAWLVAAACNASRYYWRERAEREAPEDLTEPGSTALANEFARKLLLRHALDQLAPRCREVLLLHYEGRSAAEIARALHTTQKYAEKMLRRCLERARALQSE